MQDGFILTFVGLTYLNLILIAVNASISFLSVHLCLRLSWGSVFGELPISPVIMVLAAVELLLYILACICWPENGPGQFLLQ